MTELSFLVELLLNHKLPKPTRDLVAERIKIVETSFAQRPQVYSGAQPPPGRPGAVQQAPSTQAILDRNPDLFVAPMQPLPVAVVAQTPEAIAAMNSRQTAINESLAGKVDKVTGRPRKF